MTDNNEIQEAADAVARAFGRDGSGHEMSPAERELARIDEAIARARAGTVNDATRAVEERLRQERGLSDDDLDMRLTELNGRGDRDRPKSAIEALEAEIEAAETATPWRDAASWSQREPLREAEDRFTALVSTRRGQTIETARKYAEGVLREAWHKPGGFGTTHDRFVAVVHALEEGIDRLSKLSPIAPTPASESRPPRMVQIVREGKPL